MKIYDITDAEIRTREPDAVNVDELEVGDKIGCWLYVDISVSQVKFLITPEFNEDVLQKFLAEFGQKRVDGVWEVSFPAGIAPKSFSMVREPVLMCYVASIQPHKKFKVYCDWGDTTNIEECASHGRKVRGEALVREIFPLLSEYEFIDR